MDAKKETTKKETTKKETTKKTAPAAEPAESVFPDGVDRDMLLDLGEEMNALLFSGDDQAVNYEELEDEELLSQIIEDASQIDPNDAFNDDSKATLAALGVDIEWPAKQEKTSGKKSAAAAKVKGEKSPKEKKTPPARANSMSRPAALGLVLKEAGKKTTVSQLIEESNSLYVNHGGKDNVKEAKWAWGVVSQTLVKMGLIAIDGDNVTLSF